MRVILWPCAWACVMMRWKHVGLCTGMPGYVRVCMHVNVRVNVYMCICVYASVCVRVPWCVMGMLLYLDMLTVLIVCYMDGGCGMRNMFGRLTTSLRVMMCMRLCDVLLTIVCMFNGCVRV